MYVYKTTEPTVDNKSVATYLEVAIGREHRDDALHVVYKELKNTNCIRNL
jgi:hypothetical protein